MFAIGHLATVFPKESWDLESRYILELLAPDILSSHCCIYNIAKKRTFKNTQRLLVAHIAGDYWIHFDSSRITKNDYRRTGWAYKNMRHVPVTLHEFINWANAHNWISDRERLLHENPAGFSHTIVEYTVDQYLCDTDKSTIKLLHSIRNAMLDINHFIKMLAMLKNEQKLILEKPFPMQPLRYRSLVIKSEEPDHLHLYGLASKFGLHETHEVCAWLRSILRSTYTSYGYEDMGKVIDDIISFTNLYLGGDS